MKTLSLTARDVLQKLADDAGVSYRDVANRINQTMATGDGLKQAIEHIAKENALDSSKYSLDSRAIVKAIDRILREDYTQTLMISAVLAQMVESSEKDRFPVPAFFAFLEILADVPDTRRDIKSETSHEIEDLATRMIELTTTLVSIVCEWSAGGMRGVAADCPVELRGMARAVFRKTRMFQSGLWTCISCGKIIEVRETHALLCPECDRDISGERTPSSAAPSRGRNRLGYGRTGKTDSTDESIR